MTIFYEQLRQQTIDLAATLTFRVDDVADGRGFQFTLSQINLNGNLLNSNAAQNRSSTLFDNREAALAHADKLVQKYLREEFNYKMTNENLLTANGGDRTWIEQLDDQIAHCEDADTKARLEQQRSSHVDNIACRELQIEYRTSHTE